MRPVETRCSNKGQGQDPETCTPNLRCAMKSCPFSKARTYSQTLGTPNLGDTASQNWPPSCKLGTKLPHNPLEGPAPAISRDKSLSTFWHEHFRCTGNSGRCCADVISGIMVFARHRREPGRSGFVNPSLQWHARSL